MWQNGENILLVDAFVEDVEGIDEDADENQDRQEQERPVIGVLGPENECPSNEEKEDGNNA